MLVQNLAADTREAAIRRAGLQPPEPEVTFARSPYFIVIGYPGNSGLMGQSVLPGPKSGVGFAIPVARDGYFIVPAHALSDEYPCYIYGRFDGRTQGLVCRVVFRNDREPAGGDYAIVKVDAAVPEEFFFSTEHPTPGSVAYAVVRQGNSAILAAGKIISLRGYDDKGTSRIIKTDIPVAIGDSGGPVILANGRLVAFSSSATHVAWYDRMYATAPLQEQLLLIIANDRLRRKNQ